MFNPEAVAASILSDNPDNASALFQLIVWLGSNREDPIHEAEADAVEELIYSKTPGCANHRQADTNLLLELANCRG